ncbi:polysaccharide pyruvyl transferase family protein [Dolichospermum circinale]|uniref:polysaccharide pyruvyl transferase family protein n=1 Tax=Dolichospermum circinale TaxID=109265 RepID=UPI00232D179C|nr:polysaccharide pyruvyl transferase family protein [Dolichospermum circinale]MDB9454095.1 polysaccharide pyruvyl transferase family protein [Dolichospermum circinale CS-541/06]MDB9460857.1 polysaccharide pyruvyl transferase family protein [Dolichospermum circinale CS-541/04]MDB9549568.1 polysaccharide pyruvyl transferase family protein [Dolichospermum circinale CS-1031]
MKVAIWGSYNYGNYGDDLMALQFAKALKRMGVDSCIYRLDSYLADKYSVRTTNSLEEMFQGTKFCIIGGGAVLSDELAFPDAMENDYRELNIISNKYQCPVFPISVGGNGKGISTQLTFEKQEFLRSNYCKTYTVRLKEDIPLVNKLGKEAIDYPDVLLSIQNFWDIDAMPKSSGQLHVGINIPNSLRGRFVAFQICLIASIRKDIVFHFIRTHLPNYPLNYELLPKIESSNIKHHIYTDPLSTLSFLKSLDLVVSFKLHLGLTALALNVPFYSYGGRGKVKTFMKSINADSGILKPNEIVRLLNLITNPKNILQAKDKFDFSVLHEQKKASLGHIEFMKSIVNKES